MSVGIICNNFHNPQRKREYINMTEQHNDFDFDFTGELGGADKNADRITDGGAYVGKFPRVQFVKTEGGARGMEFEFEAAQGGDARFTVYTVSKAGEATFGKDQIEALAYLMGVKPTEMKGAPGMVRAYVDGEWKEVEGIRYPALENKAIGVVLQKELTSKKADGKDSYRWNLYGQFHPTSRLTASELREKKVKPEKLDKLLRGLKDKDNRTNKGGAGEPAQPGMGASYEGV